jgi:hypothetical protein
VLVERATANDAPAAARLAELKRAEYERYSPVFWRPAADARARHEPFLRSCLVSSEFTSYAARDDGELRGIAIAHHRVGPPPLTTEDAWLVDDFLVAAEAWQEVGGALLEQLERQPLVVLAARRDEAKQRFLRGRGYDRAASWWVRPVEPRACVDSTQAREGFEAVTGPAPPVYDPGGTTALARRIDADAVAAYTGWAAAQGAVLAIVPAGAEDVALEVAAESAGFEAASDWFVLSQHKQHG